MNESEENRWTLQKEHMLFDIALFTNTKINNKGEKVAVGTHILTMLRESARIAAVIVVAISCVFLFKEYHYGNTAHLQTVAVPAGQRAQITLADGTKVWLNAQSTLTYSHDFGRNERNVELDGGAYFEVAKNKEIPFYVNTETNQVRVVETHFNVCAYRGSNEFTTTLLEGIVDIYAKGSEHSLTRLGGTRFLFSGTESSERSVLLILIISVGKMVYTVLMILLLTCCLVNWRNIIK